MPARPVGISVSARAKPGAGADRPPPPPNAKGSGERLLRAPPSRLQALRVFLPIIRRGPTGAGGGEVDLKSP